MTIHEITEGIHLAMIFASFLRNPEEALIRIVDDFKNANSGDISSIKEGICKKINCENIALEPTDTGININFIGTEEPVDVFAVTITSFVLNIANKISPIISIMIPDIEFEKSLSGISIIYDDIERTTFIEIPRKDGSLKLHVTYNPGGKTSTINIPIQSEKVLEKLRELKEE